MLKLDYKDTNSMTTELIYVVVDPTGPYVQGVYSTPEGAAYGARMTIETDNIEHGDTVSIIASHYYETSKAAHMLYIHDAQQDGKTLEDLQKEASEEEVD